MDKFEAAKFLNGTIAKAIQGGVHQIDVVAILETIKHDLLRQHFEAQKPSSVVGRIKPKVEEN
jgi:hypothetical protein